MKDLKGLDLSQDWFDDNRNNAILLSGMMRDVRPTEKFILADTIDYISELRDIKLYLKSQKPDIPEGDNYEKLK